MFRNLLWIVSLIVFAPAALGQQMYSCQNAAGERISLEITDGELAVAMKVTTDRIKLRGYATTLTLRDGTIRHVLNASANHYASVELEPNEEGTSMYWSTSLDPLYSCR